MKAYYFQIMTACFCMLFLHTVSCSQKAMDESVKEQSLSEPKRSDAKVIQESDSPKDSPSDIQPDKAKLPEKVSPPDKTQKEATVKEKTAIKDTVVREEETNIEVTPKDKNTVDPTGADAEACRLFTKGPFKALRIATESSKAQEIYQDHFAYRFTFKSGQFAYFKFNAFTRRDHVFYFDQPIKFSAEEASGAAVPTKKTFDKVTLCTTVKKKYIVNLPKVSYYFFKVGPVSKDMVVTIHAYDGHSH